MSETTPALSKCLRNLIVFASLLDPGIEARDTSANNDAVLIELAGGAKGCNVRAFVEAVATLLRLLALQVQCSALARFRGLLALLECKGPVFARR